MIPISLSLKNKKILIVGGGKVALRKVKLFLKEEANITLISSSIHEELYQYNINIIEKEISESDIHDYFLVYLATNNHEVNHYYTLYCKNHHILCGSATYDEDASFYSMGFEQNDLGLIALSMNQKLPYHKPLLNKLSLCLNEERERIELLSELRSYIISHSNHVNECFQLLFECPIDFIKFLIASLYQKSYLFVYHHSEYQQSDPFKIYPHYMLSIKDLEYYKELLMIFPSIYIVPLVLSEGKIYHRIIDVLKTHQHLKPIHILDFLQLYNSHKNLIFFIHPLKDNSLKEEIKKIRECDVYEFNEPMRLDKNQSYHIISLTLTKGLHYHQMEEYMKQYHEYDIEYEGCLLENKELVEYIENHL